MRERENSNTIRYKVMLCENITNEIQLISEGWLYNLKNSLKCTLFLFCYLLFVHRYINIPLNPEVFFKSKSVVGWNFRIETNQGIKNNTSSH